MSLWISSICVTNHLDAKTVNKKTHAGIHILKDVLWSISTQSIYLMSFWRFLSFFLIENVFMVFLSSLSRWTRLNLKNYPGSDLEKKIFCLFLFVFGLFVSVSFLLCLCICFVSLCNYFVSPLPDELHFYLFINVQNKASVTVACSGAIKSAHCWCCEI